MIAAFAARSSRPATLDELLAGVLDALDLGIEAHCVLCGGEAAAVRGRHGEVTHACVDCGSVLEHIAMRAAA